MPTSRDVVGINEIISVKHLENSLVHDRSHMCELLVIVVVES